MTYAAPMPQSRLKGLQERVDQLRVGSHGLADSQAWLDAFHKLLIEGLKMFFEEKHSCWWCDPVRQDIVMELLHVFSLPESDSVTRFKSINTRMLSECQACTLGYYKAKEKLHQLYQQRYPPENVTRFFSILATWDESRIVNNLTVNAQSATPNAKAITGALHEVLSFPKLLYSSTIRNAVNMCITHTSKSTLAELSLPMSTMLLPGLFCLVCSVQSSVRNWASDAISVRIEHANTTKWHDATQQQSTDRIISSYSKVIRYVSQSTLESPYATFTARFWRLTYKLVQSLPMDKERLFVKEHGGLIFLELAEEICRYLDNDDFAMIDKSHRSAWTSAVITFNWFASQYVDIVAYHISPEKVANIIRTIVKHFEQLQRDLDSIEGNARKDTESYINSVLGWSVETIQRLFQLPNGAKSLDIVYASIQSTVQQGNECSIYCQRQWLSGLRAICYKMAAEGVYDPLCSFIQFLDTNGMDNTFMTGMLVELIGKLVQEGISGLGQLLEISLCQKKTGQRPDRRSVACSPSIWSTLSQIQHSKARDAIINAGVATVYLWWQIPEVEHDIREHTDRITFSDAVNTLYRCFVQRVDAKPTEEKAEPFLLINGCILSMLSGVSIPGLDCTWSLYMEKLCKTDNGLDTALLRVFSQPNDQLHSIIQVSLQKFKLHYQSMNSGACSRYLRLLHAFIKSWLQSKAIPESRAHLMTIWSTLWSVLAHAIWLANKTKSTIDQREIRQRVLGIVHRLVRWQTVELKDDYVACVQLQACVPLMIGWYPMNDLSSLNSKDTHGQEAKYIDWRVPLVKAIVHTVQFISRHLGLDTSAIEATRQFVDNIKPIDGIVSHEQIQTLKRALCRKPELDLDSLLEMASDINLSDNDDVNHNSNNNSSNNTISPTNHLTIPESVIEVDLANRSNTYNGDYKANIRSNDTAHSFPNKRVRVEVAIPAHTVSRIKQTPVNCNNNNTSSSNSVKPNGVPRDITKAWNALERASVSTPHHSTNIRRVNTNYSMGNSSSSSSSLVKQMRNDMIRERAPLRVAIRQQRQNFIATIARPATTTSASSSSSSTNQHVKHPIYNYNSSNSSSNYSTFQQSNITPENDSDEHDPVLDSDSESDSDGFAGIMQDQLDRVSNTTTNQEKRTVQMIDLPRSNWIANTSITMPKRQVKPSPALPVKPRRITINDLHAAIVEWPTNKLNEMPKSLNTKCLRAADYYSSADEYIDTMQPLSIMECWQQIANALETFSQYPLTLKAILNSRSKVDNFQEIQFNTDDNQDVISENDVIIMIEDPAGSLLINQQLLARNPPIGIVREITYQRDARIIKVRTSTRQSAISVNGNVTSGLYAFGTTWRLIKITSLTTIHREFEVLGRLSNYQLCQDILQPSSKKKTSYTQKQLDQIAHKYSINASQARAVLDSMSLERGFLLIQGPPGTGKTSTILSIISSLNEMATNNENANSSNDNDDDDDDNDSHRHHTRRPLLVCAPSNAAIDEIVKRLCTRADMKNVRIVRLGNPESVHSLVKNMSLDVQAEEELERITNPPVMPMKRYDANGDSVALNESSSKHSDDWTLPTGWRTLTREAQRRMIRKMLVQRAHIICSTLSSSGHELLTSTRVRFETVLIDEASQCVELSSLIPLQYDAQRCILVGDANQLPPTVLSARAIQLNYARSLFERMQMIQPDSVDLLTVQYRMHPLISQFPSNIFYQGQIKDGPAMAERTQASWHQSDLFAPFVFFDVRNGREQSYDGRSFSNSREIDVIVGLIDRLASQYRDVNFAGRIGVITPYKEQIRALRIQCTRRFGSRIRETIDFNTIDGFQGQEKDIIFFSCVRASDSNRLGFLSDIRRMNVALTRARCSLFVVGNSETLQSDNYWGSLIAEVKERHCIYDYSLIPWLKRLPEPRTLSNLFIYPE